MTNPSAETQPKIINLEVGPDKLEHLLQTDEELALQALGRNIEEAEKDPNTDPDHLDLLKFQRELIGMSQQDAHFAAISYAQEKGTHAFFVRHSLPIPFYRITRGLVLRDLAASERWRIVGVDPLQYGDNAYGHAFKESIEQSWRDAVVARQELASAQAAAASAVAQVLHPPVFEPKVS